MESAFADPLNLGQDRMITVNGLVDIVAGIAGKRIRKRYDRAKPQGVRGRNSDNTRLRAVLGWEPRVSLEVGLAATYAWIREQLIAEGRISQRMDAMAVV
jgi:nucleoside-diphosphate-sugar epimerase